MIPHQYFPQNWQMPIQVPQAPQKPQPGFIVMPTEEEALKYPIAPGNSITFKIESEPVIIEKTMGFSQLDSPVVKKYRLIAEDETSPAYALKEDIDRINEELEKIRAMIPKKPSRKKEETDDE